MEKLYLSSAEVRRQYGKPVYYRPSRFLTELEGSIRKIDQDKTPSFTPYESKIKTNEDYMRDKARESVFKKNTVKDSSNLSFKVGDSIIHSKWGKGMIVQIKESDEGNELVVAFDKKGLKKLNQDYAPIKKV